MTYKRYLTVIFAEIIAITQPDYFLMENVPNARNSGAYKIGIETFKAAGYQLVNLIVDASYCHTPQKRKRLFCFGALNNPDAPQMFLESIFARQTTKPMTIKEHFGDDFEDEYYLFYPQFNSRAVYSVYEPSPTITGHRSWDVPEKYQRHIKDPADFRNYKMLTIEQRSRIQTFPKNWKWLESHGKSAIRQQIGNAIPVNLASFLGQAIIDADNRKPKQILLEL